MALQGAHSPFGRQPPRRAAAVLHHLAGRPNFIILKFLGIIDTCAGLIVPKMVTAFGIFLMAQFFEAVPIEIEEAARIDGANRFLHFA